MGFHRRKETPEETEETKTSGNKCHKKIKLKKIKREKHEWIYTRCHVYVSMYVLQEASGKGSEKQWT